MMAVFQLESAADARGVTVILDESGITNNEIILPAMPPPIARR